MLGEPRPQVPSAALRDRILGRVVLEEIIDPVTNVVSGERLIAAAPSALGYLQASRGNPCS